MIKLPSHLLFLLLTTASSTINLVSAQGGACFKDRAELKYAVDSCWEGGKGHFSDDLHGGTELENDANEADCDAVKVKYGWPIGTWCVKDVTDIHFLFVDKTDFNEDINSWDTSSVTDMYETFSYSKTFNGNLGNWDVSKVTTMYGMFNGAYKFEGKGLENWKTDSLEISQWMFYGDEPGSSGTGYAFDADLSGWDMSKVTNFWEMFAYSRSFKGVGVDKWDTSSGIYMEGMFYEANVFDADLSNFDVSGIESFRWMFLGAKEFKGVGLDKWQFSSMSRADQMFDGATSFNKNLCAWGEQASFRYNMVDDMFVNSGCTFKGDPTQGNKGPFCASRCEPGWQDEVEEEVSTTDEEPQGETDVVEKEPVLTWAPTGQAANTEPNPSPASDPSEPSITWETGDGTPAPTEASGDGATPAPTDYPPSDKPPPPTAEVSSASFITSNVGIVGTIIVGYALSVMM